MWMLEPVMSFNMLSDKCAPLNKDISGVGMPFRPVYSELNNLHIVLFINPIGGAHNRWLQLVMSLLNMLTPQQIKICRCVDIVALACIL